MIPAAGVATRDQAVLVVVDIQDRLAAAMERREAVISATGLLVRAAAIVGVPIVATRQYPAGLGDFSPEVLAVFDEVEAAGAVIHRADKVSFDCFGEPGFVDLVGSTGRKQLLFAGMETHICICQTALAGLREGFDVHVAADACCSRDAAIHALALSRLAHAGAVVSSSESTAYELVGRAGTPEFKALLAAVKATTAGV